MDAMNSIVKEVLHLGMNEIVETKTEQYSGI